MRVYDSNIWIFAVTRESRPAVSLVDEVIYEGIPTVINSYIYEEVFQNIARSSDSREAIDRAQDDFASIVYGNQNIIGPSHEAVANTDLDAIRDRPGIQAMSDALNIQAKDVPVLICAHQAVTRPETTANTATIYTADWEFSQLDPDIYFDCLSMRFIDCS